MMKHTISIEGIKVYAFHGCLEEEARIGGNYIVDVYMDTDFGKAAEADQLDLTIDYCLINDIVREQMAIRANLIESVAQRIFNEITLKTRNLYALKVRLTKLSPPMNAEVDKVSVEVVS